MPHAGARLAFVSEAPARRRRIDIPGSRPGRFTQHTGHFVRSLDHSARCMDRFIRPRDRFARDASRAARCPGHLMRHLSRIMLTCALCASAWTIFAEGLLLSLTITHVLNPPSPAGDRVVAVHYNFCSMGKRPHTSCRAGWDSVNTTRHSGAMTASTPSREMTTRWHGTETNPSCWSPALLPIPCGA